MVIIGKIGKLQEIDENWGHMYIIQNGLTYCMMNWTGQEELNSRQKSTEAG